MAQRRKRTGKARAACCDEMLSQMSQCYDCSGNISAQGLNTYSIDVDGDGIIDFYNDVVKDYHELFLYDDLWISYFLYFFKKNKILSLQEHLKKDRYGKRLLIYKTHIIASGLVQTYGKNLIEAVRRRDQIAVESFKYMQKKTKGSSLLKKNSH